MSTLLLYRNVVPLNRERHASLKLAPLPGDYDFARDTHFVPLAGHEFFVAAKHYPVLFSGGDAETGAVALLGVTANRNLFVNRDGSWEEDAYVPAFVRRYPFALAGSESSDELTVCFDDTWKGFGTDVGEALFADDGEQTDLLKGVLEFLQSFHAQMARTRSFIERLGELDLLVRRDVQLTDEQGGALLLKDFRVVDTDKLATLADEAVVEFHRAGWLPWIYAHALSLGNLPRLQRRLRAVQKSARGQ